MENEINKDNVMQKLINIEYYPDMINTDFSLDNATKISLKNLSALGVAFLPLSSLVQTMMGDDKGGICYVNTHGKSMFKLNDGRGYIGALKSPSGAVGGGQATITKLPLDPTMFFMAAALMNIEKN